MICIWPKCPLMHFFGKYQHEGPWLIMDVYFHNGIVNVCMRYSKGSMSLRHCGIFGKSLDLITTIDLWKWHILSLRMTDRDYCVSSVDLCFKTNSPYLMEDCICFHRILWWDLFVTDIQELVDTEGANVFSLSSNERELKKFCWKKVCTRIF